MLHEFEDIYIDEIDGKIMNRLPIHRNDISSANDILHDSSHSESSNDLEISHCVDVQMDAGSVSEINREMNFELSASFRNTAFNWGSPVLTVADAIETFRNKALSFIFEEEAFANSDELQGKFEASIHRYIDFMERYEETV